jgi:hypothetical protein
MDRFTEISSGSKVPVIPPGITACRISNALQVSFTCCVKRPRNKSMMRTLFESLLDGCIMILGHLVTRSGCLWVMKDKDPILGCYSIFGSCRFYNHRLPSSSHVDYPYVSYRSPSLHSCMAMCMVTCFRYVTTCNVRNVSKACNHTGV